MLRSKRDLVVTPTSTNFKFSLFLLQLITHPILLYYKNAIMRKFVKPESVLHQQMTGILTHMAAGMGVDYKDMVGNGTDFTFDKVPPSMNNFCK